MLMGSNRRMSGLCFERWLKWKPQILLLVHFMQLVSPKAPVAAFGSFLGDTKAVLEGCDDHWTLQSRTAMPLLSQMTVCVDIRVVVPGSWVAFSYSSVYVPGLSRPELGLEGDDEAIYAWLLRVRHRFPLKLLPEVWHRLCLRRDVPGNSLSLEVDGRMVAERTVIAHAIPPSGSLWLGCHPRHRPAGSKLGVVELYLFRVWADLGYHGMCEDGSVIGWGSQYWGVTSPKARQEDPYLMCDPKRVKHWVRISGKSTIAAPPMFGGLPFPPNFMARSTMNPTPPPNFNPANQIPGNRHFPATRTVHSGTSSNMSPPGGSRLNCYIHQLCSTTNAYFWIPIIVRGEENEDVVRNLVSEVFDCQDDGSDASGQVTSFMDFCQENGQLKMVKVSCSPPSPNKPQHLQTCNVVLPLSHAVPACELQRAAHSALQQVGGKIEAEIFGRVERVALGSLCEQAGTSGGEFIRCSSTSSLEDICQSYDLHNLTCSALDLNSHPAPIPQKDSCSRRESRSCDCTASCQSQSQFYAVKISFNTSNVNMDFLKHLLLRPNSDLQCNLPSQCQDFENIKKSHERVHVGCHGTQHRLNSCMVMLEMSRPINGCALYELLQQKIGNNVITMDSSVKRTMVCGSLGLSLHSLLMSRLTWISPDMRTSDLCSSDPTSLECKANETFAVQLNDSCPLKSPTSTPLTSFGLTDTTTQRTDVTPVHTANTQSTTQQLVPSTGTENTKQTHNSTINSIIDTTTPSPNYTTAQVAPGFSDLTAEHNLTTVTLSPNHTTHNVTSVTTSFATEESVASVTQLPNDVTHNATTLPHNITMHSLTTATLSLNDTTIHNVTTTPSPEIETASPLSTTHYVTTAIQSPNYMTTHNVTTATEPHNNTTIQNMQTTTQNVTTAINSSNVTTGDVTMTTGLPSNTTKHNMTTITLPPHAKPHNVTSTALFSDVASHNATTIALSPNITTHNASAVPPSMTTLFPNDTTAHNTATLAISSTTEKFIASTRSAQNTTNNTTLFSTIVIPNTTAITLLSNDTMKNGTTVTASPYSTTTNIPTLTTPLSSETTKHKVTTPEVFTPSPNDTALHNVTKENYNTTLHNSSVATSSLNYTTITPFITSPNQTTVFNLTKTATSTIENEKTTSTTIGTITTSLSHTIVKNTTTTASNSPVTMHPTSAETVSKSQQNTTLTTTVTHVSETSTTEPTTAPNTDANDAQASKEPEPNAATTASLPSVVTSAATTTDTNTARTHRPAHAMAFIHTTNEATISEEAQEKQASELLNQTQDVSQLNSSQVTRLVGQLEKLLEGPSVSQSMGEMAINIISNLMGGDSATLSSCTNRLIRLVDNLGLKMDMAGERAVLSSSSLVLAVKTVNGSNFPTTSVDFVSTSNVQLRGLSRFNFKRSHSALGSVFLPSSLTSGLSPEQRKQANRIQFTFYTRNVLFQDVTLGNDIFVSPILGTSVANLSIANLTENIEFVIRNLSQLKENVSNVSCVFWDFSLNDGLGGWSCEGCYLLSNSSGAVTCSCNHLTSFAILLDFSGQAEIPPEHAQILTYITYIGCGISVIFLAVTLLTYLSFEKLLRDIPAKILVQLCFSLLFLNLVFLLNGWLALHPAPGLCISTGFFLHYFLLTSFTWAGLEALHMYLSIVRVFTPYLGKYMLKFTLMGWGIPLIVVIVVISVDKDNYGLVQYGRYKDGTADDFCWLQNDVAFYVGVVAYFLLIFILCLMVFVVVMVQLYRIKKQNPHNQSPHRSMMADLRSITGLIVLLGLTWGFALFAWGPLYLPFIYLFSIFNSLQGFFIFVFHCAAKENVRRQWRTYLCCGKLRLAENSDWSRTATQNNRNISLNKANTSALNLTSRSSSVISDATNSSGSVFADSGISDGSNSDVVLNEIHRRNLQLQAHA